MGQNPKIIDSLHIRNNVDKKCKELYSPESVKLNHPDYNTMAAEQTFVWLSRFKKILAAMSKTHHLFYLHRMVKIMNRSTELCYRCGRKPLLPTCKKRSHEQQWNYHTMYNTLQFYYGEILVSIPYSVKIWWEENLVNLMNCPWFAKLKPSKLVLTIDSLLADLFIHYFFHQMLEKNKFTKLSHYSFSIILVWFVCVITHNMMWHEPHDMNTTTLYVRQL